MNKVKDKLSRGIMDNDIGWAVATGIAQSKRKNGKVYLLYSTYISKKDASLMGKLYKERKEISSYFVDYVNSMTYALYVFL